MKILSRVLCFALALVVFASFAHAQNGAGDDKIEKLARPATKYTIEADKKVLSELPFNNHSHS